MDSRSLICSAVVAACLVLGCEAPELPTDRSAAQSTQASAETVESAQPAPPSEPVEFTADSPQKGRRSKAAGGYLGAVGHARFWAEHELIRLNIVKALDLFNATEGRYPKSHEEFMSKIIEPNNIVLPELPEGEEYIYDPEDHLLKVQLKSEK